MHTLISPLAVIAALLAAIAVGLILTPAIERRAYRNAKIAARLAGLSRYRA